MRYLYLLLIFCFMQSSVMAQFSIWKDTIEYQGFPIPVANKYKVDTIYNDNLSDSIELTWTKISENLATGWTISGICDPTTCYLDGGPHKFKIAPGGKEKLYVQMSTSAGAAVGCSYAVINLSQMGGGASKDIVYKYCAWPTSVKDLENNLVSIYPNPANDRITITLVDTRIASVNVLSVVGRKLATLPVDPSKDATLNYNLNHVANGVYLLQFADNRGKILGVRRVTKN